MSTYFMTTTHGFFVAARRTVVESNEKSPMKNRALTRREFIARGLAVAASMPLLELDQHRVLATSSPGARHPDAKVAIVQCRSYGPELRPAFDQCFDLLGGIGPLVKDKTVTVKLNLTGTNFTDFLGKPVGETYMTHPATAMALAAALFRAGARRVRFVESTQSSAELESTLSLADWDIKALQALGPMEFENTRNLGKGKKYSHFKVPGQGYMFSSLDLNHAYEETDVMVSLAKLKNHVTAGVTLSMKNLFGILPGICYGWPKNELHWRGIHNSIVDIALTRTPELAIVDGIIGMEGDGPLNGKAKPFGALVMGHDLVAVDATCCRLMMLDPEKIGYLVLGAMKKLGRMKETDIAQLGESISSLAQPFEMVPHLDELRMRHSA